MSRRPGTPKTGGRTKGTPNRRNCVIAEKIESRFPGWDPVEQLAHMAQDQDLEPAIRVQCAREVATYIHPRRKPGEARVAFPQEDMSLAQQGHRVVEAMLVGDVTLGQGGQLLGALVSQAKLVEADELEDRVRQLEEQAR